MRPTTHGEESNGKAKFKFVQRHNSRRIAFVIKTRTKTPRVTIINIRECQERLAWNYYFDALGSDPPDHIQHTCSEIREILILRYVRYAAKIANVYLRNVPEYSLASREDIHQAAFFGLIEAIDRYQLGHGTTFTQFANRRIAGAIIDCLRNLQDYPRIVASIRRQHREDIKALTHKLCRFPTSSDIEDHLGTTVCCDLCDPLVSTNVYNQFSIVDNGEEKDGLDNARDMKPKKSHRSHNRSLEHEDALLTAIDDDDIRFSVYAKYWLNWNLRDIGKTLNCSASTVHNKLTAGRKIIKNSFQRKELEAILSDE